ncbi:hypothetical protein BDR26DRAFT_984093 [Obelidium mucronatum]|nr:hypothetical protein BDR26DRAFT_984093 [Obelidium mucronatum]
MPTPTPSSLSDSNQQQSHNQNPNQANKRSFSSAELSPTNTLSRTKTPIEPPPPPSQPQATLMDPKIDEATVKTSTDSLGSVVGHVATVALADTNSTASSRFSPTQLQVVWNSLTSQKLHKGQLVHVLPLAFFTQLRKAVERGDAIPAIISYDAVDRYLKDGNVVDGVAGATYENPSGFIVVTAAVFRNIKDCFHIVPSYLSSTAFPIVDINPDDVPYPDYATAYIDIEPVTVKLYPLPATSASDPFTLIHASTKWDIATLTKSASRSLITSTINGDSKRKKVLLWDLNSGGAGFGTVAHIDNGHEALGHLEPINGNVEGKDREFAIGVELLDEDEDEAEFPDSSSIALGTSKVSFKINNPTKETPEQKRARIMKQQKGIDLSF